MRTGLNPSSTFTSWSPRATPSRNVYRRRLILHVTLFGLVHIDMATSTPLPVPPRTPTPPPEDENLHMGLGLEDQLSPTKLGFNMDALSPMSATFPSERYGTLAPSDSLSQRASPSTIYSPMSASFPYTPASAMSGASDAEAPSLSSAGDARNPFNFQPVTYMPNKPPGVKNVCVCYTVRGTFTNSHRMLADVADTSTSTAASPTRSFSNLPREPRSSFLRPSPSRPSKNTARACPRSSGSDWHGASATCAWPAWSGGALTNRLPSPSSHD